MLLFYDLPLFCFRTKSHTRIRTAQKIPDLFVFFRTAVIDWAKSLRETSSGDHRNEATEGCVEASQGKEALSQFERLLLWILRDRSAREAQSSIYFRDSCLEPDSHVILKCSCDSYPVFGWNRILRVSRKPDAFGVLCCELEGCCWSIAINCIGYIGRLTV